MITRRSLLTASCLAAVGSCGHAGARDAPERLTYEASRERLRSLGLDEAVVPLNVNFYRTALEGSDLSRLTLPRTFFGRSETNNVSFANSDLHESNLCWAEFVDVDFRNADLSGSDLRASSYTRVRFDGANLRNCDLRRSTFEGCTFSGADLHGAVLTREQGARLILSVEQRRQVAWAESMGEEPGGA